MASGPFAADLAVHKVSPQGLLTESAIIPTPYSSMVHDFVITENYILLPILPISGSLERAMEGAPPFAWEPGKGAHLGIIPRHGGTAENIRWLEMDLCFVFHFMNGYDLDGVITVDACQYTKAPLFPTVDGETTGASEAHLTRWTIDLNAESPTVDFSSIDGGYEMEFPQCDLRYAGRDYQHGWYLAPDGEVKSNLEANELVYNSIGHVDHRTGQHDQYSCGNALVSEAIFVPVSADAKEGEGYMLSVVTDFDTRTSSLFIFDALSLSNGPLAKVHLSHYVPVGFHGTWRPGD